MTTYDYPTVEWVKVPVDRATGRANGRPIERRHFADCDHWYRNEDGSLVGAPARLATDQQMASLAPCADCAYRARRNGHPERGERLGSTGAPRQFWWVSQGYNFDIAIQQQTLWSLPKKGRDLPDRRLLKEMRTGDVVLHYADQYLRAVSVVRTPWRPATRPEGYRMRPGDGDDGWLVEVDVRQTGLDLHFHDIASVISHGAPGPLDKNGTPRQLYVARLSEDEANALLDAVGATVPAGALEEPGLLGMPDSVLDLDTTDATSVSRVRREQAHLRRHLLAGRSEAPCALCSRVLPQHLLVAAHIVPRRHLDDAERLDFRGSAMLACSLGCDALFEWGHVVVDPSGMVRAGRPSGPATAEAVAVLEARTCTAHNEHTALRFAQHRASHPTPA